ncbi:Interferon-induced very large GTPase 1 [Labeo rohita]|uniref:Interferon-induced very large GTPase 1 n=1 Tax=Labeo rohita TaxID=84645 RepID=A0ABQ8LJN0_LABRO|nr:Interferon-induced very large GTPase 1 [Labeo rohita]
MNSDAANKMFFPKWLSNVLDEHTLGDLSALHHKYNEKWSTVLQLNKKHDKSKQLKAEQTELEKISEQLQNATFGLEHIMREIGQIYESCSSLNKNKKDLQIHFSSLTSLAAEMMISGFPLELMDGDAAHVPVIWISAVLDQLIQKLGDQRVFVLSVLGLQSSGKSTMLNAMFGLQFAVRDVGLWLKSFPQQLSDELIFSEKDLSGVKHDDVDDFNLLKDVIKKELPSIISASAVDLNTNTFPAKLDVKFRPDQLLIDDLCQCCWEQCPFCAVICTNTIENHDEDHSTVFHGVNGVNGSWFKDTTNLCVGICTTSVASSDRFFLSQ